MGKAVKEREVETTESEFESLPESDAESGIEEGFGEPAEESGEPGGAVRVPHTERVSLLTGEAVNSLLHQINNLRGEAARIKANAVYLAAQKEREAKELLQRFLPNLETFAHARLDGTRDSEVRLLGGTLGYKTKPATWAVAPLREKEAITWAEENYPSAIRTAIDKSFLTFRLQVNERGEVVDRATGEIVAWAQGTPADRIFFVK